MPFSAIPEILDELRQGRLIVLVDDEDRENEGDLIVIGEKCTPQSINFMITHGRGVPFIATTARRLAELKIPMMTKLNTSRHGTAMAEMVDAVRGTTTGVSAFDRAATVAVFVNDGSRPDDLARPGHVIPLRAEPGGVLVRAGHTEAIVDLCHLAGFKHVGVGCEVINTDGTMMRRPQLEEFCAEHHLKMCTIAELISYRLKGEQLIRRVATANLPTNWGTFNVIAYETIMDANQHLALCKGGVGDLDADGNPIVHEEPVLVRVHSECLTGDVFGSNRCDCGPQLSRAMETIEKAGKGALVYLRQEGRGIGLVNKLRAYALQEKGLDTVEANQELGMPVDKRDYGIGSQILRDLGLRKIRIMTNNPKKIYGIEGYGLQIVEEVPIRIEPNEHNRKYLQTKKEKLGHKL
ncbi:MAG TPA: GTP cyclohydrolase II [Tepidisphaeraceae bacterium]|nr:GTP cyclohydrolase II [Tepidisphaeraceae bacterium]